MRTIKQNTENETEIKQPTHHLTTAPYIRFEPDNKEKFSNNKTFHYFFYTTTIHKQQWSSNGQVKIGVAHAPHNTNWKT